MSTAPDRVGNPPFDAGPFRWLAERMPEAWRGDRRLLQFTIAVLVAWLPAAMLAAIEGHWWNARPRESFLIDFNVHGRYLVAMPLLIAAASTCLARMGATVRQLTDAGFIAARDRPAFDALVSSTRRLLDSRWTEAAIIVLAYGLTLRASPQLWGPAQGTWIKPAANGGQLSLAGWWVLLVSQPLFLAVVAGWAWRLTLWTRFIWRVSQFRLTMVASHPDRLGGLGFMILPMRAFVLLAFALGAVGAGIVAESVVIDGRSLGEFKLWMVAQTIVVLLVFAAPMLALMRRLILLQAEGTIRYGRLAHDLGRQFEAQWLNDATAPVDRAALGKPDFSATTDLYSIVANVRDINLFVFELRQIVPLAVAALLPYVPVVLYVTPMSQLMDIALKAFV